MNNSLQTYATIVINDQIEYAQKYIYLELISTENCMHINISRRITNTWKRFWSPLGKGF